MTQPSTAEDWTPTASPVEKQQAGKPKPVRYIFIVTYGRSGSTLLQKIIAQIPGCHMSGENEDALGGLYRSWKSATVARTVHGNRPRLSPGEPWRGAHRIDPHRYNRRLARVFLKEIVRPPIGAKWIGFKEIRYFLNYEENLTDYLDYIRMTFSPALLVFNRRRAAEVAQSSWWKTYPTDVTAKVTAMDAVMETYAAEHPDETLVLDYDAWSVDPDLLRPLHERLRTPFDEQRIRKVLSERLTHV